MIGGVLVERTVAEVLPALEQNKEQVFFNYPEVTLNKSVFFFVIKD
jgi:hypothetical protein